MRKTTWIPIFLFFVLCTQGIIADKPDLDPLDLEFKRLAVRRFIFSNNINLCEFEPSQIVAFKSMHPAFLVSETDSAVSDDNFNPRIEKGVFVLDAGAGDNPASVYVGGVNPYATYEINIDKIKGGGQPTEIGIELARTGLRDRIQFIAQKSAGENGIFLRIFSDNELIREINCNKDVPEEAFSLKIQLYGRTLGMFITEHGETEFLGSVPVKEHFGDIIDFRKLTTAHQSTFNIFSNLQGRAEVRNARSYLSAGMGQADIRLISYEDLSPYIDDNGRLWFTFSCRGIDTPQSTQGVLSLDPSVFDIKFEGMIVFDHGDGMLRNDYASHLFYDRNAREWRAYVCDFGGSYNFEGRAKTGLITATSNKDPRRGFSVMKAARVEPHQIEGHNEDPCIFYDKKEKKWKLLTSAFVDNNITSRTYEGEEWNGTFKPVQMPIKINSTGTSIQWIGNQLYAFMGGTGNLRVHTYPDLEELGEIKMDFQPHWPKPAGRVWASIVPLPAGYPYRYVLLTMDRANFPEIKGANWSYGALYFYGANPDDISSERYEFR